MVVVTAPETRRALRDLYLPHWRAYLELTGGAQMLAEPDAFDPKRTRMVQRANEYAEHLDEVPVHLVLGVQLSDLAVTDESLPRTSIVGGASIYPFAQNLLLALRNEGLGASMTTLLVPAEAEVRELLGIPPEVALAAHIGVGHRADDWPKAAGAQTGRRVRLRRAVRRALRELAPPAAGLGCPGPDGAGSPIRPAERGRR